MTQSRREALLSIAFAVWGLAVAISLITIWDKPAPPGQLPGFATKFGFDAHGPFRWVAGLMLLPVVFSLALRPVARRVREGFAFWSAFAAPLFALWFVSISRDLFWTFVPCAIVIAICCFRTTRISREDGIVFLVFLAALLAIIDLQHDWSVEKCALAAALLVFVLRAFLPTYAFALAPLAMLTQVGYLARDQRYSGWVPVLFVVLSPVVLRFVRPIPRRVVIFAVYPLALWAYSDAVNIVTAEGRARVSVFEDSHSLLPASQYLRGELPYRDIMPLHGLVEDGLVDYAALRLGPTNMGPRMRLRTILGSLNVFAVYALAFAVGGSAELALFAVVLSFTTGTYTANLRLLPALVTLALLAGAVRWRRPRWFAYAGVGTVACGITSVDFGFYAFATFVYAVLRQRGRALRYAIIGVAAGAVPLAIALAAFGILDDFARVTFLDTLSLGPVYVLNFFTAPAPIAKNPAFPDMLVTLLDHETFQYVFWCAMAIVVAVAGTRRPRRRIEPYVILGVFVVVTAIAYGERHHLFFNIAACPVIIGAIRLVRRNLRAVAVAAAIVLAGPTTHVAIVSMLRHARGPLEPNWVQIDDVPRARGALYLDHDAEFIRTAQKYVATLAPDETFFDFTNRGILYFFFDRDCPIREYEVADYQTPARQEAVIRRLEANQHVRAVLLPGPSGLYMVDTVPNAERAPLVWKYIQTHFHPDFAEGDVVFWRRN